VVEAEGACPWGTCPDPPRADAVEAQLLSEAKTFDNQVNMFQLPEDTPIRVKTPLDPGDLLLLSERLQTECSITIEGNGGVIFYKSSKAREASVFAEEGDQITYRTHPGVNEVMASVRELNGVLVGKTDMVIVSRGVDGSVADMKYTVAQAQELLGLLDQGNKQEFLRRIEARYQAKRYTIVGTVLEENMRKQGMIP
jgi:hypothetical protein